MAHVDFIFDIASPLKPIHWKPLGRGSKDGRTSNDRSSSFKVFISAACRDKHKTLTGEIEWLAQLRPFPVTGRHKFELIDDSASLLHRLGACDTLQGTRCFKWFVVKGLEHGSATTAVASVLSVAPDTVKHVIRLSDFVSQLGSAANAITSPEP